ncbi:hypothetical protein [Cellulosimicrobium marinum]|uniref:hypothetical protein n=1 Tax=Cellulosimicrobium marinum TaxID=1638992 RepID=UPI001E3534D8|nr:hypothetical protein [Cellulosimicrobium marinum]MCB7135228.1 hypothetical protein [Cellulosimicrobium marinum]
MAEMPKSLRRHVHSRAAPELLYGAVVTGSVLAVSSTHAQTGDRVAIGAAVVAAIYWLAHVYVDAVGGRFTDPEHSTGQRLAEALRTNTGVLVGSVPPILVFIGARALGIDVPGAAFVALWFTVAVLAGTGAYAAARAGDRGWRLVGETCVAAGFGLVVILLKVLLH